MKDFFRRAKDLYFTDTAKYGHFQEVFERIDNLARVKNYFTSDLFDIEEVLSILDIDSDFGGGVSRDKLTKLIVDVIAGFTPNLTPPKRPAPVNWASGAFGDSPLASPYGYFVAEVCRFALAKEESRDGVRFICTPQADPNVRYDLVTLNYDCVLENLWRHVAANYEVRDAAGFARSPDDGKRQPMLCKLHGSVDTGLVIPPTSRKLVSAEIKPAWDAAFAVLSQANHVRVIGYSLPPTDTYIRYLLEAAVARAPHLKTIHVLCLDNERSDIEARYREFISFKYFEYRSKNTKDYLRRVYEVSALGDNGFSHQPGRLEEAHADFFGAA